MEEPYVIRSNDAYLQGFNANGSSNWTLDPENAVWVSKIRAETILTVVKIIDDIDAKIELVEGSENNGT